MKLAFWGLSKCVTYMYIAIDDLYQKITLQISLPLSLSTTILTNEYGANTVTHTFLSE